MTNAYRLLDDVAGLVVDRYGSAAIIYRYEGRCTLSAEKIRALAEEIRQENELRSVWLKEFFIDRNQNSPTTELLLGEADEEVVAVENDLKFLIRPREGYSPGLFLDQKENRKLLGARARDKRVLNGFAYTCGFSVACAKGGAREVMSVDLSKRYLEWGKENFALNGVVGGDFLAADLFAWAKRAGQWDLVILDPPSFSRSKKTGTFSLKKDLPKLLKIGVDLTAPGGEFFFSCNHSELSSQKLRDTLETERKKEWIKLPTPPSPLSCFLVRLD